MHETFLLSPGAIREVYAPVAEAIPAVVHVAHIVRKENGDGLG